MCLLSVVACFATCNEQLLRDYSGCGGGGGGGSSMQQQQQHTVTWSLEAARRTASISRHPIKSRLATSQKLTPVETCGRFSTGRTPSRSPRERKPWDHPQRSRTIDLGNVLAAAAVAHSVETFARRSGGNIAAQVPCSALSSVSWVSTTATMDCRGWSLDKPLASNTGFRTLALTLTVMRHPRRCHAMRCIALRGHQAQFGHEVNLRCDIAIDVALLWAATPRYTNKKTK